MADEKRQLTLDLLARNKMRKDTLDAADDLDRLGRSVDETDKKTKKFGKTTDEVGRNSSSWASKTSDIFGTSFLKQLTSTPFLATGGATIGAILAPTLGAAVAAGVLGAVGGSGIIGGIAAAASSDQAIKDYATKIGKDFVTRVQEEGRDAFSGPIMDSLSKFESFADRSVTNVGKIFQATAPMLSPFVDNVIRGGDALSGSLVRAAEKSGPVMDQLGRIVGDTAVNLGKFIDMAADNSDAAASGLEDINSALQNTVQLVTVTIDALATMKGGLDTLDSGLDSARYWLEDHAFALDLTADGYKKGSEAAELYRQGIIGAAGSANDYTHYLQGAVDGTNSLSDAHSGAATAAGVQKKAEEELTTQLRAQIDPAFGLLNAIDQVHEAQNTAAEATKRYGSRSDEARTATRKLAEAAIGLQSAAGAAGGTLDGRMTPSLRSTLKAAGLTKGQIAAVAAELERAHRAAEAYDGTYKATIKTVFIEESYRVGGADYNREANRGSFSKRAAGGPVIRGKPYLVGENGPELVVPDSTGRVLNGSSTRGMMVEGMARGLTGTAGAMMQGGSSRVRIETVGGADQGVATLINYLVRTGKINVSVAS